MHFSARVLLSKLVHIGAKVASRKTLMSVGQKWISQNSTKDGPFGSAGGPIPESGRGGGGGEGRPLRPPSKSSSGRNILCYLNNN